MARQENAIPIHEDIIWNNLSLTRNHDKKTSTWTGKFRGSLNRLEKKDARLLEEIIIGQTRDKKIYEMDEKDKRMLVTHQIRRLDKTVTVSVPEEIESEDNMTDSAAGISDVRESHKIQSIIANIGSKMGYRIWIPKNDRTKVQNMMMKDSPPLLDILPLNYDDTTLKTIEQIDVLWLKGRSIVRAFEVEHTTSIYSGILRMADLLALQPNMDIKLHIVAPFERRDKVLTEIHRPIFSFLDRGPLSESCSFISYDSMIDLSKERHLTHFTDSVLEEYTEEVD